MSYLDDIADKTIEEVRAEEQDRVAHLPAWMKVRTFSEWRKLKYGISTKAFHRKSKKRKEELRAEYHEDTGYIAPRHAVPHDWDEDELDTSDVDAIFKSVHKRNEELYQHFEAVRESVRAKTQKGEET
jgi:hypothetical protein